MSQLRHGGDIRYAGCCSGSTYSSLRSFSGSARAAGTVHGSWTLHIDSPVTALTWTLHNVNITLVRLCSFLVNICGFGCVLTREVSRRQCLDDVLWSLNHFRWLACISAIFCLFIFMPYNCPQDALHRQVSSPEWKVHRHIVQITFTSKGIQFHFLKKMTEADINEIIKSYIKYDKIYVKFRNKTMCKR